MAVEYAGLLPEEQEVRRTERGDQYLTDTLFEAAVVLAHGQPEAVIAIHDRLGDRSAEGALQEASDHLTRVDLFVLRLVRREEDALVRGRRPLLKVGRFDLDGLDQQRRAGILSRLHEVVVPNSEQREA